MRLKIRKIINNGGAKTNSIEDESTIFHSPFFNMWEWGDDASDELRKKTMVSSRTQRDGEMNRNHEQGGSSLNSVVLTQTTNSPPANLQPFQRIDDKNAWMYSAYFDHVAARQGRPAVRVFGIVHRSLLRPLYCNFSLGNTSLQVTGKTEGLPEHHSMTHLASYVVCRLSANVQPTHVSLSYNSTSQPNNRLQITYPGNLTRNFTVCYSVLFDNYNMASLLLQNIEMNRILGAEHFMVYNYSISPAVNQILQRYQEDGLVTVLPWPVPTQQVHYYGQMAALNDCNYRNRNTSRFVVVVDTDEFIIPRNNSSWMQLIDSISPQERDVSTFMHPSDPSKKGSTTTRSFQFRSSFFSIDLTPNWTALPSQFPFSDDERNTTLKFKFQTLSQFWRGKHIFPRGDRTKYIVRPEEAYVCGIHFVHVFTAKFRGVIVNDTMALVHHYRQWDLKGSTVVDTSMLKFKNQLYPRLIEQCQRFPSVFT
ncbi:hypothetical protein BsWGS_22543 [Bradybaena similaris]